VDVLIAAAEPRPDAAVECTSSGAIRKNASGGSLYNESTGE